MRDFNFFSDFLKTTKASQRKNRLMITVLLVLVLVIGGAYAITEIVAIGLRMDISSMEKYMQSSDVITKKKNIEDKKNKLGIMKKYTVIVDTVVADFEKANIMKSGTLEQINSTLPQGVFFSDMTYNGGKLDIKGFSNSGLSIAELVHNLNGLGIFESVHISTIGNQNANNANTVDFMINCMMKGGMAK